ncbi:diguanylate cyclase [Alteromonas sp. DY56-G5]|jgi:diguanylate cyclase (GGDEF)-like protein|uniref:diguanylate cyclase domain-containing protein n=1 Tax=unclassified Alteromonas TaxID=2614992 RepID=UPI00352B72FE|tara:strand:+ start:107 stop:1027 length:921 start_codon:yes stop_codon:yes gene_type:complete
MNRKEIKPYTECNVLIVDDEPMSRMLLESILELVFTCATAESGEEAISYCEANLPDLVLLDMNMPDISGLDVCSALKASPETNHIPVIFVTSTMDIESENACWEVGASDFVMKPVNASTLTHRIKTHLQNKLRTEFLKMMTFHDQLTGLYNRMYLTNEIPLLIKQVARDKGTVGAIMIDIDYFKLFNDTYGHLEGDICLQKVAQIVSDTVKRPKDAVIRFGGEEFLVVLPYIDHQGTKLVAHQLVEAVAKARIPHGKGIENRVSISAGFAVWKATDVVEDDVAALIEDADISLFEAKELGRNQAKG